MVDLVHVLTVGLPVDGALPDLGVPGPGDRGISWAASGAMALTGRRDGPPLLGPAAAAPLMDALAARLAELSTAFGRAVVVDGAALLGERAAIAGHSRQGPVSCGGACRLLRAQDGWIAISLPRDEDLDALPAWLECASVAGDAMLAVRVATRSVADLVERAAWLGLACGALGEERSDALPAHHIGAADPLRDVAGVRVLDLSSLWAGPLCTNLLALAGAEVVKLESVTRPDGARRGPAKFFDLLHAGKRSVALDFTTASGRAALRVLVDTADVVVEASRPRALEQLGLDARASGARVWVSITGHGREQPTRVGFGDDCAVAGGLVAWDDAGPVFAADAAADPAAGLIAAVAVLDRLHAGGRWLLDVSLARSAALLARRPATAGSPWTGPVAAPRARAARGRAPEFGANTDEVLAELGR